MDIQVRICGSHEVVGRPCRGSSGCLRASTVRIPVYVRRLNRMSKRLVLAPCRAARVPYLRPLTSSPRTQMALRIPRSSTDTLSRHPRIPSCDIGCFVSCSIEFVCITRSQAEPEAGGWRYARAVRSLEAASGFFPLSIHLLSRYTVPVPCVHDANVILTHTMSGLADPSAPPCRSQW